MRIEETNLMDHLKIVLYDKQVPQQRNFLLFKLSALLKGCKDTFYDKKNIYLEVVSSCVII